MSSTEIAPPHEPGIRLSTSFARGLWRIASADVTAGNRVVLLPTGARTFDAMCALIETATTCVKLEGYIFRRDEVGQRFAEALGAAAERGVRVQLLVDWVGRMGTPMSFFDAMRRRGVEVRIFSPPGFHRWLGLAPRDHRKLLVVDDAVGVTGGIGIGTEWTTGILRRKRSPWRDWAVRIDGPAAADMTSSFDRMWRRAAREERRRDRRVVRTPNNAALGAPDQGGALVGIIEGEPTRLRVARALQLQSVSAERTIWIASAYFAPSFAEVEALAGASRDGVDVRVLVPSRYDHPWMGRMTRSYYKRLLANGIRLWEWGGEMMHAKTSIVDGRWVRVGSTDFNPLGLAVNYELDAVIEDAALGREAEEAYLADLERSREIRG